jgi:hypothetical protein
MKYTLPFVLATFLGAPVWATDPSIAQEVPLIRPAVDSNLSEFLWINRPIVVFADNPADPRFIEQMDLLSKELDALALRDVVVLTDTDPGAKSAVRTKLRPRGFAMVLVGKDGTVNLRKPRPWTVRELSRAIDKMPDRQREIRERRSSP